MDRVPQISLWRWIIGYFARTRAGTSEQSYPLGARTRNAWFRGQAQLLHEYGDPDDLDEGQLETLLNTIENGLELSNDRALNLRDVQREGDNAPFPLLQAVYRISQNAHGGEHTGLRLSKRKRDADAVLEAISPLVAKRQRITVQDEPDTADNAESPQADVTMHLRRHSIFLHCSLRERWKCKCHNCSGMRIRLSFPQQDRSYKIEACFEVFFDMRSSGNITLKEAWITVKHITDTTRPSPTVSDDFSEHFDVCKNIRESLNHQNCLHLLLEDGQFTNLRPETKNFNDLQIPRAVSLADFFERQAELPAGKTVLPMKGKRILAFVLAAAMVQFMETPWTKRAFDHSKIQFFHPFQNDELPDITKPFLAIEDIPMLLVSTARAEDDEADKDSIKQLIHPNSSVLALGILLCELHFCTSVRSWTSGLRWQHNVNSDYCTSLEMLQRLKNDASLDYYSAAETCIKWKYFSTGAIEDFESAGVQGLFYRNVVERLASELFKFWSLRPESLSKLSSDEKKACWGPDGCMVVRGQTSSPAVRANSNEAVAEAESSSSASNPDSHSIAMPLRVPKDYLYGARYQPRHPQSSSESQYLFDSSYHLATRIDLDDSRDWMRKLCASLNKHVKGYEDICLTRQDTLVVFDPVRVAILDSGFDPTHEFLIIDQQLDPRIKGARNFMNDLQPSQMQDNIGHGTHGLGCLLKAAPCAEIYVAKVADSDTLDRASYDNIAKAIEHAVSAWNADVITMSFGIRQDHEQMQTAIDKAISSKVLLFAAASNDGGNSGRAFPATHRSVFCIHSTDHLGNGSSFNPNADDSDANFALLGENVESHWPRGVKGHNESVNAMTGTSVATPIAAGLAASILSFVRQQEQSLQEKSAELAKWLKDYSSMHRLLKENVRKRKEFYYLNPEMLLDPNASSDTVYRRLKDSKDRKYRQ